MSGKSAAIEQWVNEVSALTTPDRVVYCDGSQQEGERLIQECLATGGLDLFKHALRITLIPHLVDYHARPFAGEHPGNARSRPPSRASNQRDFVCQKHSFALLLQKS